jgi:acyl-CoA reductase-like NAD-dependent aldehyde dehydrogenase
MRQFDHVTTDIGNYHNEMFGLVLQMVFAKDFEEALSLPAEQQHGTEGVRFWAKAKTANACWPDGGKAFAIPTME